MGVRSLLIELTTRKVREYLSESTPYGTVPRIYPPATDEQIFALESIASQELDEKYREFLSLSDGMEGFFPGMRILGCRDWAQGESEKSGLQFLDTLRESRTPVDVGLPEDTALFPVAIDEDEARGIFMLQAADILPERFWWVGEGDSMFFGDFADLLGYVVDMDSYFPRESVD
ncbi:SMI1/KNR4 family protein [Streptomyces sp. NPDC046909]|uniref:SMI1/KNR4 family protein n=1 Tax=Streptomyces sp. NPDC046909 TaxID=3155617 RepID=UPI0033D29C2A